MWKVKMQGGRCEGVWCEGVGARIGCMDEGQVYIS